MRSTTKYWVRTTDVSAVKNHVLQHLPVFQFEKTVGGRCCTYCAPCVLLQWHVCNNHCFSSFKPHCDKLALVSHNPRRHTVGNLQTRMRFLIQNRMSCRCPEKVRESS